MELSRQSAMKIVSEISAIIGQHVNMMDEAGYIIASTDAARLGTFHEGAATLIAQNLSELIIDSDTRFEGSRKGINLPLMLNNRLAGVIGVTGEYKEVMMYGRIIKKMTEAMMQENYQNEQKKIDDRISSRFLDEWMLDGVPITPSLVERGARLNIDVRQPHRVMVLAIADFRRYSDTPEGQVTIDRINRRVRAIMESYGGIFNKTATRMICLFPGADATDDAMVERAEAILATVKREFGIQLHAGVDDSEAEGVSQGYQQASKAVQGCGASGKSICLYSSINLEIFMDEIPQKLRQAFIRRIFRHCSDKEMEQLIEILQVYFETNGSINQTANRLFLHKNTLQYRLKKMHEKTGYNPRHIADSALIYLAIQFYLAAQNS